MILLSLVAAGLVWFFWQGFRSDPALEAAAALVRRDSTARLVLGEDIQITGVEGRNFSFAPGTGAENDYTVDLRGSRGDGVLEVRSHGSWGSVRIDTLRLTGPDGQRYDLMNHSLLPSRPGRIDHSI